jgi:hypothetical protein
VKSSDYFNLQSKDCFCFQNKPETVEAKAEEAAPAVEETPAPEAQKLLQKALKKQVLNNYTQKINK